MSAPKFSVPTIAPRDAKPIIDELEPRLVSLIDLMLTIKHVHWNVVGPHFIAAHTMLDRHLETVALLVDSLAERIATMGGTPIGTPGHVVDVRTEQDYELGKATVPEHMAALDVVYSDIIEQHRAAAENIGEKDPVTENLLIDQLGELELLQWLVRAHIESSSGEILTSAPTPKTAARKAREKFGA